MEDKEKIFNELEKLKTDSGFRIPDGYFDTLSSRITDRINSKHEVELNPRSLISILKPHLALVAFFTGIAFLGYFGFSFLNQKNNLAPYSNEVITEFISYYYSGVNDFDLFDVPDDVIDGSWLIKPEENDESELIDYLMLHEVDINSIINEL